MANIPLGWLLLGSLALCWLVLANLELVTQNPASVSRRWLVIGRLSGAAMLMGIAALGGALQTEGILILAAVTCALQVALDVFWRERLALGVPARSVG